MKPWRPQCYTKVHASDSLGNNSQLKKFLLEGLKYILEHKVIFFQRGGTWKERPDDIGLGTRDCILGWLQSRDLELKIGKKKKKSATLSLRFVSPKFYAVHVAESLVHASHWLVSLEMSDAKLEWWWLSLGLTQGEMFPTILISLSCRHCW